MEKGVKFFPVLKALRVHLCFTDQETAIEGPESHLEKLIQSIMLCWIIIRL